MNRIRNDLAQKEGFELTDMGMKEIKMATHYIKEVVQQLKEQKDKEL